MEQRFASKIPTKIFVMDVQSGLRQYVHETTTWINHLQFSPVDTKVLMFCHEGPWHKADRLWLLDPAVSGPPKLIHRRSMHMEIWGARVVQPRWQDHLVRFAVAAGSGLLARGIRNCNGSVDLVSYGAQ
jgi:hypothetical protein